jgi:cell division protein FtsW
MNLARLPWIGPGPKAGTEPRRRAGGGSRRGVSGDERRRPIAGRSDAAAAAGLALDRPAANPAWDRPAALGGRDVLQRIRHQPDYAILVAVVALTAIGILMVYSSSALKAYVQQDNTLAIVGPQILWGAVGLLAMVVTMRMDYRVLRLVSLPGYILGLVLLVMVFVPAFNRVVGGSARWLVVGPLPAVHPAEIAKLALIIYLAHWLANRGPLIKGFQTGTVPFLVIALPVIGLVFLEPDLGTTVVVGITAFGLFFLAGARLWQFGVLAAGGALGVLVLGLRGYQAERIKTFLDPWADPLNAGFHTIQGLLALGLGGIFGSGLGESKLAGGLYLPNAWNDFIFAIIGEEFGFVGAAIVIALFLILAYAGIRTARRAPDTFGALLAAGITIWLCFQAFINIGVVVALLPVTGITLPFVSAGGTSLVVSFAAVGVLLAISRETVEGPAPIPIGQPIEPVTLRQPAIQRRTDAPADRRRGNGRPHLPGPRGGGRPATPRRRG